MKLKKLLPILLLALVIAWFILPGGDTAMSSPAATAAAQPTESLTLLTSEPSASPVPTKAPKPSAAPTPEPTAAPAPTEVPTPEAADAQIPDENGSYTSKDDVALYIHTYGHLPPNFISKKEAEKAGWSGGSLERVLPGMCIGGDYFGNYEGQLPKAKGRKWTECDINTLGARSRGAERIVFSNDGLIYYTPDHYEHFELLYD